MIVRATKDFFAPETQSQYVAGMTYTVRPGSALSVVAQKWIDDGRFQFVSSSPGSPPSIGEVK